MENYRKTNKLEHYLIGAESFTFVVQSDKTVIYSKGDVIVTASSLKNMKAYVKRGKLDGIKINKIKYAA